MIETLFKSIAKKYDIENVFSMCEEKTGPIAWFTIDERNIAVLESTNIVSSDELTRDANKRDLENISAYYLDSSVPGRESNIPIFAYNSNQIVNNEFDSELIIVHEISHLIDIQNISENLNISLIEIDKKLGEELDLVADKIMYDFLGGFSDLDHNENFSAILSSLIRRIYPDEVPEKLAKAMKPNFQDYIDYYSRFKEIQNALE
ncbi:MAG TPA: hypothetical protein PKL31_01725 [Fulvivirga sp.]|nr:hypothetical protein [Fulvivirga sp.]